MGEIDRCSAWQNGNNWMTKNFAEMPIRTLAEITLTNEDKRLAGQENKRICLKLCLRISIVVGS